MMDNPPSVDEYLATVADDVRPALESFRARVKALAPGAVESISYGMLGYKYKAKVLLYLGGWKNHLAIYGTSAGTLRFQPEEPPSDELLRTLIDARRAEIEAAPARKRK